jgi:hypothetical protein
MRHGEAQLPASFYDIEAGDMAAIMFEKIGPFLYSKSLVLTLNIEVPKISLGIKSGVN